MRARFRVRLDGPGAVDLDMVSLMPADTWKAGPERPARRPRPAARRPQAGLPALPRRLHRRGPLPRDPLPVEEDHRRARRAARHHQPLERRVRPPPGARLLPVVRPRLLRILPAGRRHRRRAAADPELRHGLPVQHRRAGAGRRARSVRAGRARPDRVRQRSRDQRVGRPRARDGAPGAVQPEDDRRRQRAVGAAVRRALRGSSDELSRRSTPRSSWSRAPVPSPSGERFDFLWGEIRELGADIVDEHYYAPPRLVPDQRDRYDNYPRNGPKVFAGEFAAQTCRRMAQRQRPNTWNAALAEAAFMTGLERNADVVGMASYAPLFAHVDAWQWTPNLIWFDNLRSFGTPSYYVQTAVRTAQRHDGAANHGERRCQGRPRRDLQQRLARPALSRSDCEARQPWRRRANLHAHPGWGDGDQC